MATARVAVIFGGSGIVGSGVIKALLEKPKDRVPRIVVVTTSAEKIEGIKQKFGNLPEDKLLVVAGTVDTEENGAKLKDDILAKTDNITDVLSCIGGMGKPGKVLDVSLDEFKGWTTNLNGHFVAAKTFLPFISDQQDSSYTFITGGGTVYIPNLGCVAIIGSSLLQLSNYIRHEWESKPVRINEVSINVYVTVEPSPGAVINTVAGRGIAAVMMDSNARGKRFVCTNAEDFNKLTESEST